MSNKLAPPLVCPFYLGKEVYLVVGLPEVVLYVVVLGWYAQLDELLLESARLLKEAVYSSVDFHCRVVVSIRLIRLSVRRVRGGSVRPPRSLFGSCQGLYGSISEPPPCWLSPEPLSVEPLSAVGSAGVCEAL